ncbi:hypothetical protein EN947_23505, partial [Mesorhizobium sp. M7A.F.Ca.US.003.02.2.1]
LALLPIPRLEEYGIDIGFRSDKLNHASAFAVMTFLGGLGWPDRKTRLIVFLAMIGAAIEVLQGTALIRRDLDVFDWFADCAGIACGLVAVICVNWILRRRG